MTRVARVSAVVVWALSALLAGGAHPAGAQAPAAYYAAATGHVLAMPFLRAWADGGAFTTFGNPVSEPVAFGKRTRQFFEYGALEVSSKQATSPSAKVTRLPVGALLLAELAGANRLASGHRAGSPAGVTRPASRSTVDPRFASFYDEHGGEARFGAVLMAAETSAGEVEQWFAYGRLEIATDGGPIGIAPVGFELAAQLGAIGRTKRQVALPLLDAKRFHPFVGDGTVPEASGRFTPVRIVIPAIAVDAKIEQIAIEHGVMGTPADAWNVGWYRQISTPGEWTNVVMAGHLDWWGIGPTVFYHLGDLTRGDKIYLIGADGKGATYLVVRSYAVDANADPNPIITDAGIEMLTLITCGGNFDGSEYLSRQIVRAKRI